MEKLTNALMDLERDISFLRTRFDEMTNRQIDSRLGEIHDKAEEALGILNDIRTS